MHLPTSCGRCFPQRHRPDKASHSQFDLDRQTAGVPISGPDSTVDRNDHPFGDRQPEPVAVARRLTDTAEEGAEDPVQRRFRHPRPVVADAEAQAVARHAGLDADHAPRRRVAQGIAHDVLDGALQQRGVCPDLGQGARQQIHTDLARRSLEPGVLDVEIDNTATVGAAIAALEAAGIGVKMVRSKSGRLEEVFMRLTAGDAA